MLPKIEDRGQRFTNWGEKFTMLINKPVTICFVILQN